MERARLGQSDLELSTLVFGSMGHTRQTALGEAWGISLSPDEHIAIGKRFGRVVLDRDRGATFGMKLRRRLGRVRERIARLASKGGT